MDASEAIDLTRQAVLLTLTLGAPILLTALFVGLVVSYHADTSASATIAVTPIVLFFVVLAVRSIVDRRRSAAAVAT